MDEKWLSVQSMRKNQSLIAAINILSIHLKLKLSGEQDVKKPEHIQEARNKIVEWITEFDKNLTAYVQNTYQALTGISPRQQQLVKRFESAKRKGEFTSKIFQEAPITLIGLLIPEKSEKVPELLQSLSDLRSLLEEHNQIDIHNLVPDL